MLTDTIAPFMDVPTYVSALLDLPAHEGPAVFEQWWSLARRRSHGALFQVIEFEVASLELDPVTWRRGPGAAAAPFRQVRGRVKATGRRAWPVELELLPWSSTTCELGLRFSGRRLPSGRRLDRYHEHAAAAVSAVRSALLEVPRRTTVIEVRHPDAA
ncbi:MAG: hypothetical protein WD598_01410 [Acidimicrobiia bacterium]